MKRNKNNMVNICADALIDVISHNPEMSCKDADQCIESWIKTYTEDSAVGAMLFNANYHVSYTPSEVWDTAWKRKDGREVTYEALENIAHWSKYYIWAHKKGLDPFRMAIGHTHKQGAEAWLSVRMNEYHYLRHEITSGILWVEHPEYRIREDMPFDYMYQEVRDYYKAYIAELCTQYDIDGIELDILRGPWYFKEPITEEKTNIMTAFLREIRTAVNKAGKEKNKKIRISARTYPHPEKALAQGWDPVQWVADGSVDVLTLSNFFVPTSYEAPVRRWETLIAERGVEREKYSINVASDFCVFCVKWDDPEVRYLRNDTQAMKGFAAYSFHNGADGIYTFNVNQKEYTCNLDTGLWVDFKEFTAKERAERGKRSHILTHDDPSENGLGIHLPQELSAGAFVAIQLDTAAKPALDGKYVVTVGTGEIDPLLRVSVNGRECRQIENVQGKAFEENISQPPLVWERSEAARCMMRFQLDNCGAVKDGINEIVVTAEEAVRINWFEITVEN